ncbi:MULTISPECIES: hypothetical protein [unclassified Bradyrhizobium]|uniref:hypothetical protein n=1 Tax=unclassified Bradyrhizobium TaxID=2631580 RepID=UPI0028F0969C|nr:MULTISPECIES: hypothetical protein [unclassified Bradyrhizobium]
MTPRIFRRAVLLFLISALYPGAGASAQQRTPSLEDLAKAAQNPIADTISVGLENIAMPNTGAYRQTADVPVGAGIGKLFMVDKQPVNAEIGVYYNVLRPDLASRWQFRASLAFLFPK